MNANFGIVATMPGRFKGKTAKQDKNTAIAERSLARIDAFCDIIKKEHLN
jgi:methylenetetrahydrofolate--tRNA-(uracil-5-)-methyltransferase